MRAFKDANGKDWLVQIDVAAIKLVRAKLTDAAGKPLDLYRLVDGRMERLAELLDDPILLVDTLYVLCSVQATKDGVTDEQFGRAMYGDALERAVDAFLEALIDFFPSAKSRAALTKVRQKQRELTDLMTREQMTRLENLDVKAEFEKVISAPTLNGASTSVQASSASTPTPSPSVNLP